MNRKRAAYAARAAFLSLLMVSGAASGASALSPNSGQVNSKKAPNSTKYSGGKVNNTIVNLEKIVKDYEAFDALVDKPDQSVKQNGNQNGGIPLIAPAATALPSSPQAYVIKTKVSLDLPGIVQLAVTNDPVLAEAIAKVEEKQNLLNSVAGQYWPSFSLNTGAIYGQSQVYENATQGNQSFISPSSDFYVPTGTYRKDLFGLWSQFTGLSVNYALVSFARQASYNEATASLLASRELYANRLRELQLTVSEAYYEIQLAQQLKKIKSAEVFNDTAVKNQAASLYASGLVPKVDVLRADAALQQSIFQLKKTEANLLSSQRKLSNIVNVPFDVTLVAPEAVKLRPAWPLDLPATISLALHENPQLLAIQSQRTELIQKSKKQQAALLPSVNIYANGGLDLGGTQRSNRSTTGCCGAAVIPDLYQQQYGWSIGLLANWLFFDAGVTKGQVKASLAAAKRTEQEEAATRNAIRQLVEQAFYDYRASLDQIIAAKASYAAAKEAFKDIRARYLLGLADYTDVSDVVRLLTKAMEDKATAITSTNMNYSRLLRQLVPVPSQPSQPVNLPLSLPSSLPKT
jgi:outer membrane protein TolC